MKTYHQIISIMIIVVTCLFILCISSNAMTNEEVTQSLDNLKNTYIDGLYWNHPHNLSNDANSVTNTPCTHHGSGCQYNGACGCNSFNNAIQCHGFAKYLESLIFPTFPSVTTIQNNYDQNGWVLYTNGSTGYSSLTLEPGDFIRCSEHSAIVWKIENDIVYVAQTWGGADCEIDWTYFWCSSKYTSEAALKSHARYIVKAPKTATPTTTYTVTYNGNGGSVSTSSFIVGGGQTHTITQIPTYSGYTFLGWSTDSSDLSVQYTTNSEITVNSNITLYAIWGVTVTYKDAANTTIETTLQIKDDTFNLSSFSLNNFDIIGWTTSYGNYNTVTYDNEATVSFTQDTTLYAVQTYTVTYNGNGGSPAKVSDTLYYNEQLQTLPYATRTGFKFIGWYSTEDQKFYPASVSKTAGHITLYAGWQEGNKIYFNCNNGIGDTEIIYRKYNQELGILPMPTRTNYKFDGWWFTYPGTDTTFRVSSNTPMPVDYDIILTAKWEQGAKVYFITNGGECEEEYRFVLPDEEIGTLPIPTKDGYTFAGWYDNDEFIGSAITASLTVTDDTDFALFAKWIGN